MIAFGIVGASGSGKTTLIEALIPRLIARGLTVATVKLTHHDLDLDHKGKDSRRHREAGAGQVALIGPRRAQVFFERPMTLDDALARLEPCDLVLVEGFIDAAIPKIEVHRPALGKAPRALGKPGLVAVASDAGLGGLNVPVLALSDPDAIAALIADHVRSAKGA